MEPYRGPWELIDSFMHWERWLGVQDTIVDKSDPALPLRRETDFKTNTQLRISLLWLWSSRRVGKEHNVLNGLTRPVVWLEGE